MNNNNYKPGDEQLPSPEDRQRAVAHALKNSKWASAAVRGTKLSDEQKAQKRLEEATLKIFNICAEVKNTSIAQGHSYDEAAMGRLAMSLWMDFTNLECKEALRFMLSTVVTGAMLEAIAEL